MRQRIRRAARSLAAATTVTVTAVAGFGTAPAAAAPINDPTCRTPVNGSPVRADGPSATNYALNVGGASELGTVWDPPGAIEQQAAFPSVVGVDSVDPDGTPVRRQYARFSLNLDDPNAPPRQGLVESVDGGATFPAATYTEDVTRAPALGGVTRLRDGTLLGYSFVATEDQSSGRLYSQVTHVAYRSTDDGRTWQAEDAKFNVPSHSAVRSDRIAGQPLELADGTILVVIYGSFSDTVSTRVQVQASTDGGRTFHRRGIVAPDNADHAYNETAIAALPSGKLIAVSRHQVKDSAGALKALSVPVYTTSTDQGATWAPPQNLSVSFPNGDFDPIDDTARQLTAVAPDLKLMPNGVLVLRAGRPDNWVAISTNGQGTGWVGQLTYRNCPAAGIRWHGSTGYGGVDYVSANRALVLGDNCEKTWACDEAGETGFTVDRQNRVWRRWIDVLTPDVGRIDLATKYRKGKITVGGDLTTAVPGQPRARVSGAFDGSTEYWSSAVRAGGPGTYVLNLDRSYPLTKIGLSLRNGRPATGRVSVSTDGVHWGIPVATAANRTHLAMEYFTLPAPTPARFVKVELDATANCDEGLGDACAFLNELELYSSINSFENDPVNNRPRGFTDIVQSWQTQRTSELDDNDSASALVVVDTNPAAVSQVAWNGAASTAKSLEFRLKPVSLLGFLFDVVGKDAGGATVNAYHLAVAKDGALTRFDGNGWVNLTGPGAVPPGTWSTISVTANTSTASLRVNGATVATNLPFLTKAGTLHGYKFSSNGTLTTGDRYLVDDVLFTN